MRILAAFAVPLNSPKAPTWTGPLDYSTALTYLLQKSRSWLKAKTTLIISQGSEEFGGAVKTGVLGEGTFAFDCIRGNQVPNQFEPVAASAWLYDDNLKDDAKIWEHSLYLPNYNSTLTLLYLKEPVERRTDFDEETDDSLNPEDFSLGRRRWPK